MVPFTLEMGAGFLAGQTGVLLPPEAATAAAVLAAGMLALFSCRQCHADSVYLQPAEGDAQRETKSADRRSTPAVAPTVEQDAPAAVRLQQARGRPSPWHWRSSAGAGAEAGSALLTAAGEGDAALVQTILDSGADIHYSLDRAAARGEIEVSGWTPFHVACWSGHIGCVRVLVRCGCDTAIVDAAGRTGRDLAQARGNAEVLDLLDGALAELKAQRQAEKKARRKKQKTMRAVLARALASLKGPAAGGLILELGVASGQSINFIADNLPDTATAQGNGLVHGFDSFEGLPERWRDGYAARRTFPLLPFI